MDILGIPLWLYLLTVVMALVVYYVWYMSMDLNLFERMGVAGPGPMPILGNLGHIITSGLYQSQVEMYQTFKENKVFGIFDSRTPCLVVTDLKLIQEILVNHFDSFPDRQRYIHGVSVLHHSLPLLQGHHWERVRKTVAPILSSPDTLRRIPSRLENCNRDMLEHLKERIEEEEEIDLRELSNYFNVESILSTCYGIEEESFSYPQYAYMSNVRSINFTLWLSKMVHFFFPFSSIGEMFRILGICSCEKAVTFFNKLSGSAVSKKEGKEIARTLMQLIEEDSSMEKQGKSDVSKQDFHEDQKKSLVPLATLSDKDLKGQAFSLTLSSYNTLASVMSYTIFMLANNSDCCQKVQEEIDAILESETKLDFDNVHRLVFLDMCIKETMRMFPSPINIDRICVEDVIINGVLFPKGMPVFFPTYAIHHDPEFWSDPQEFKPERFGTDCKEKQIPFSYLPFGEGPRKCVGKDLAMLQIKIGIAAILRNMTPVPSYYTVYPVKLSRFSGNASDGLWVDMRLRSKKDNIETTAENSVQSLE